MVFIWRAPRRVRLGHEENTILFATNDLAFNSGYAKSNHLENDTKMSSVKKTVIRTLNTPNFQIRKTVQKSLKCFETRTMIFSMTKQHLEERSSAHGKSEKKQHWHDTIANYEVTTSGWRIFLHSSAETGLNRWQN